MSGDPLVWQGKFLEVRRAGHWEYAGRKGQTAAVVVLAIDDERHVLLVEQERPPLGGRALELPAGLVGDEEAGETVAAAAARELHEECGYRADRFVALGSFASSPGMISETFNLVRATGLRRDGADGGVAGEDITVHRVALDRVAAFVEERRAAGVAIDSKLLMLLAGAWL